jgi:hypothetical protein
MWPFLAALATGVTFIGSIFTPWAVPFGGALVAAALVAWFWPKRPHREEMLAARPMSASPPDVGKPGDLP